MPYFSTFVDFFTADPYRTVSRFAQNFQRQVNGEAFSVRPLGTTSTADTLSGTLLIDVTTGELENNAMTLTGPLYATFPTLESGQGAIPAGYYQGTFNNSAATVYLILDFPTASLVGYTGGELCDSSDNCPLADSFLESTVETSVTDIITLETTTTIVPFDTLSLSTQPPTTPAPEPSSIALLGVGLTGLVGIGWRRNRFA